MLVSILDFIKRNRLRRDQRGSILIELAAATPVIVLLSLAGFEISRLAIAKQKMSRAATSVADLVSQAANGISEDEIDSILTAVDDITAPIDFGDQGVVYVSGVVGFDDDDVRVNWQVKGGGTLTAIGETPVNSKLGTVGSQATLPANLDVSPGQTLIVAEVYFNFEPIFLFGFSDFSFTADDFRAMYEAAWYRPRLGALQTLRVDG